MRYAEIEKSLLSGISENDPYKVSKQLQIKQWTHLYGSALLRSSLSDELEFITQVISDDACWEEINSLEGVKLNRYKVGRKLLATTMSNGEENPFNNMQKYKIACWCCFEDQIRELWDEAQSNFVREKPIVRQLDSTYAGHGPMVTYWSYYISGHMDKFKKEFKREGDNNDLHGFENAVRGKHAEALEYFWNRLQPVLSSEEKEELLIYTATYYDVFCGRANSDMVDFAMNHLDESKYHRLLRSDVHKHGCCSTLYRLIDSYLFDRVKKLYSYLDLDLINQDKYSTLMYLMLNRTLMISDDSMFMSAGYDTLDALWRNTKLKNYKQEFVQALSYGSPTINNIAHLIKKDKVSDILSEIVGSLSLEQAQNLQQSKSWAYEILKIANLFNDDVMKHLAEIEQTSVNTLESQEEMVVFGAGSSIDNQELDIA